MSALHRFLCVIAVLLSFLCTDMLRAADSFRIISATGTLSKVSNGVVLKSTTTTYVYAVAPTPTDSAKQIRFDVTPASVYGCCWGSFMNPKKPEQSITVALSDTPAGYNGSGANNSLIWELAPVDGQPKVTLLTINQHLKGDSKRLFDAELAKLYPQFAVPYQAGGKMSISINLNGVNGRQLLINERAPTKSNGQGIDVDLSIIKQIFKGKRLYLTIGASPVPNDTVDGSIKIETVRFGGSSSAAPNSKSKEKQVDTKQIVSSETGFEGAVSVVSQQITDGLISVTVNIPYLDIHGKPKMGQARLFVKESLLTPGKKFPLVSIAHYETDLGSARAVCDAGWAAVTPHYGNVADGEYPLEFCAGDSVNLAKAINQWARRLPFIDRSHLHIFGGSAGGYMTLAMAAESFPVSSAFAGQPLFNLAYNLNYLGSAKKYTEIMINDGKDRLLPVISVVVPLVAQACDIFSQDLTDEKWYYLSPLSYLDRITCPIVVTGATGDTLCPSTQLTVQHVASLEGQGFPEAFSMDFNSLIKVDLARKRLDEVIPANEMNLVVLPKPADAVEMGYKQVIGGEPAPPEVAKMKLVEIPWSKAKQWTLLLHDEGAPATYSGHFRYFWNESSAWSFASLYQTETPSPAILNEAKLARLMDRYTGVSDHHVTLIDGKPIHRLNYDNLEKLDVVTGLLDYAEMGAEHLTRLNALYEASALKPLGATLGVKQLTKLREGLLKKLR